VPRAWRADNSLCVPGVLNYQRNYSSHPLL